MQSVLVVKTTEYASHVLLSNQFSVPSHQSFWSDDVSHLFQQLLTKPVLESFVCSRTSWPFTLLAGLCSRSPTYPSDAALSSKAIIDAFRLF